MTADRGVALTPDLLQGLFEAVDSALVPVQRPVDLLAVGGTAMLLRWHPRRVTYDVDLVTPLPAPVKDALQRGRCSLLGAEPVLAERRAAGCPSAWFGARRSSRCVRRPEP